MLLTTTNIKKRNYLSVILSVSIIVIAILNIGYVTKVLNHESTYKQNEKSDHDLHLVNPKHKRERLKNQMNRQRKNYFQYHELEEKIADSSWKNRINSRTKNHDIDVHGKRKNDPQKDAFVEILRRRQQRGQQRLNQAKIVSQKKNKVEAIDVGDHEVAGLNCDKYGGPPESVAAEMVYWNDIPDDASYKSPFADVTDYDRYLTFEPDEGGWNNIRMSMETAVAMAHAMGRILVLPPTQTLYLMNNDRKKSENNQFTFKNFFHFDSIQQEHPAIQVITMQEFLERTAMQGQLRNKVSGEISFPPFNITNWDGTPTHGAHIRRKSQLWPYMRSVAENPIWNFDQCVVAFPAGGPGKEGIDRMKLIQKNMPRGNPRQYHANPTPVDASPIDRLTEMISKRTKLCIYDEKLQKSRVLHLMGDNASGARLLVHFYAFLFFENWRQDVWTKRFIRDHIRYIDEIQCGAARVVAAIRELAKEFSDGKNIDGVFDTFHIRRGDFQYKMTRINATQIYENVKDVLEEGSTVYIATDERDKKFFDPLREHYNLLFFDDFSHLLKDINVNFSGMLDQLIASRGRTFLGAYYSTFTSYINRIRGYHSQKSQLPGYHLGELNSYYYVEKRHKFETRFYEAIKGPIWAREFPVGWRDIDHDLQHDEAIIT